MCLNKTQEIRLAFVMWRKNAMRRKVEERMYWTVHKYIYSLSVCVDEKGMTRPKKVMVFIELTECNTHFIGVVLVFNIQIEGRAAKRKKSERNELSSPRHPFHIQRKLPFAYSSTFRNSFVQCCDWTKLWGCRFQSFFLLFSFHFAIVKSSAVFTSRNRCSIWFWMAASVCSIQKLK